MSNKGISRKSLYRVISTLLILVILVTMLTGCKKKEVTLESYVNDNPSEQAALQELMGEDQNAKIEFEGNTMRIIYTVNQEAVTGIEDVKALLEEAFSYMEDVFNGIVEDLEEATGIEGISIEIIYLDEAGNEIAKNTYVKK